MEENYQPNLALGKMVTSEDEAYLLNAAEVNSRQALNPTTQTCSTSSLSDAMDPDADAEGEPDDLDADADADGIEDDDGIEYEDEIEEKVRIDRHFEHLDGVPTRSEQDEDSGDDEEYDGERYQEDSGEEMDLDENTSSSPPSPPSRLSEQAHHHDPESSKKPLVLKLKLAAQPVGAPHGAPPARAPKRKYRRSDPVGRSTSNRSHLSPHKKVTSLSQRQDTDEEDELAEELLGSNSEMDDEQAVGNQSGLYQASDDSDGASTGEDTMPGVGQLTVRQRAKEFGEPVTELQSLPMTEGKKKKELTEADRAMEKAEKSRKRKHQIEKKLEDEKTETINRLLKGQAGKAGKSSGSKGSGALDTTEENSVNPQVKQNETPPLPTLIRTISSVRSGEFISSLNFSSSILRDHSDHLSYLLNQKSSLVYPPPVRPPPKSWKLVNGVRVN